MLFNNKQLEQISEDDLKSCIINAVPESKTLDYKSALPTNTSEDKKEFLKDVSAFANASGGFIIYGISENDGIPVSLNGLQITNPDEEIRRLEGMIYDGIEPRIAGIIHKEIPLSSSSYAIITAIPKSFALPHMVKYNNLSRFYTRHSKGSYQLDVSELRSLFLLSETLNERIKYFRTERLSKIIAGETPVPISDSAKVVLHIIPYNSFDPTKRYEFDTILQNQSVSLAPIYSSAYDYRYNFDGYLSYTSMRNENLSRSYLQIFRSGIIESVDTSMLTPWEAGKLFIPSGIFEQKLIDATERYIKILQQLGVEPPIVIMVSLLGVSGYTMAVDRGRFWPMDEHPIDRDMLLLPDVSSDTFGFDVSQILRPVFNTLWNATGWSKSINYNKEGKWVGD